MTNNRRARFFPILSLLYPLLLLAAVGAALLTLGYQARPGYSLSMGDDTFERHYLTYGWHDVELGMGGSYRWTMGHSTVGFQGVGRQPMRLLIRMGTSGFDPQPDKRVEIYARGALVAAFSASNAMSLFEAPIAPEWISRASGDLNLLITSESFEPTGDPRSLGVAVTLLQLEPADPVGLILPPAIHLIYVVGIGLCVYFILALLRVALRTRLLACVGALVIVALLYASMRPAIAFYAGNLLLALALSLLALLVAQPVVGWLYRRGGISDFGPGQQEARALFGLFVVGLAVGWGGLLYPQSIPHDFGFHLNRFREVQAGDLFFDNYVVGGVGQGFYPPAMYVLLLPFSLLVRDPYYLVRLAPVLFSVSLLFVIYYLARRYFVGYGAAPLLAATVYTVLPIHSLLVWWAHETNLFGLVVLVGVVAYMLLAYRRMTRPAYWLGLVALLFVLLLSHPGVLVWSVVLLGTLLLVFLALRFFTGRGSYKSVFALGAALAVAGLPAYVFYYSHYVGSFGQAAGTREAEVSELSDTLADLGDIGGVSNMARLTFYHGVLGDYALWPLLLVPVGLALLFRRRGEAHDEGKPPEAVEEGEVERFRWTLAAWVAIGVGFLAVSLLTGIPIRPMLLLWPPVSLLAGLALAHFVGAGRSAARGAIWRRVVAGALLTVLAALSLLYWTLANFLDMRVPHIFPHVF